MDTKCHRVATNLYNLQVYSGIEMCTLNAAHRLAEMHSRNRTPCAAPAPISDRNAPQTGFLFRAPATKILQAPELANATVPFSRLP